MRLAPSLHRIGNDIVASYLIVAPEGITLVDGMRGSSSLWYRVRVNLQHVPDADRPAQEDLIADYDPWAGRSAP